MTAHLELCRHVFLSRNIFTEHYLNRCPNLLYLVFFWIGFVFNTTGTGIMFNVAGGMQNDIHGWTGMFAIILMLIHAIWASIVLLCKDEKVIVSFHKFNMGVWLIWLIPYLTGFFLPRR
jgi:uncharacterized repeat protein (TIGR03987 family)